MLIEDELPLRLCIVEHSHLSAADNGQFLLLVRVQPAYKDVRSHAAVEFAGRQGCVENPRVQVATSVARHRGGHFAKKKENGGNVVRRETPKNVLRSSQVAQIQKGGIDVFNAPEFATPDQVPQFDHGGVVLKNVSDHQNRLLFRR